MRTYWPQSMETFIGNLDAENAVIFICDPMLSVNSVTTLSIRILVKAYSILQINNKSGQ